MSSIGHRDPARLQDASTRHALGPHVDVGHADVVLVDHGEYRVVTNHFAPSSPGRWARHRHDVHELLWSARGVLTAETDDGWFAVPATAGLWIPAGTFHSVQSAGGTGFLCTFMSVTPASLRADRAMAVTVVAAVAELLVVLSRESLAPAVRRRCEEVVFDLLSPAQVEPMVLPMPVDERLLRVARELLARPHDSRTVEAWASELAMSVRHLSRRFREETGMSFERWRLHARVRIALGLLAQGLPVAVVGRRVGYASPSGFVQAFARVMGHTPGWYQSGVNPGSATADPIWGLPRN